MAIVSHWIHLTPELSRPSLAILCVEVDLLKHLPSQIWLECGEAPEFLQDLIYEKVLPYYAHCKRLGHDVNVCKLATPNLAKPSEPKEKQKDEFRRKATIEVHAQDQNTQHTNATIAETSAEPIHVPAVDEVPPTSNDD